METWKLHQVADRAVHTARQGLLETEFDPRFAAHRVALTTAVDKVLANLTDTERRELFAELEVADERAVRCVICTIAERTLLGPTMEWSALLIEPSRPHDTTS